MDIEVGYHMGCYSLTSLALRCPIGIVLLSTFVVNKEGLFRGVTMVVLAGRTALCDCVGGRSFSDRRPCPLVNGGNRFTACLSLLLSVCY